MNVGELGPVNVCCGAYPGHRDDCTAGDMTEDAGAGAARYPIRQKSAHGWPKPETSIGRCCRTCGASFIGLAPGRTGERGVWRAFRWYCSVECNPED